MQFDNTFTVTAPIDAVWDAMLDVKRVAPCVPGASVIEQTGDNTYRVAIKIKLGPVSMTYNGDVEIVEADPEARRAVMSAKAMESRGQGTADATVEMRLSQVDGATQGALHTDVAISGKAAAMGQGIIGDVSARLIETFAGNLATMLSEPRAPAEAAAAAEPAEAAAAAEAGATAEPATAAAPAEAGAAAEPATAAATAEAGATAEPATAAAPPPPPPLAPPPAEPEGLPVLSLAGGVIAQRLRNPKVLAVLAGVLALVLWRRRR